MVDAVCEVPYGSHPTQMPYLYYSDEAHIREWMTPARTDEGTREYFEKYVFGVAGFDEYLERIGGLRKLRQLRRIEQLRGPAADTGA